MAVLLGLAAGAPVAPAPWALVKAGPRPGGTDVELVLMAAADDVAAAPPPFDDIGVTAPLPLPALPDPVPAAPVALLPPPRDVCGVFVPLTAVTGAVFENELSKLE